MTQRRIEGFLGVHVADLFSGGNVTVQKAISWPRSDLLFGTWEQTRFRFRGSELEQEPQTFEQEHHVKICE